MGSGTAQQSVQVSDGISPLLRRYARWIRRGAIAAIVLSVLAIMWVMPTRLLATALQNWSQELGPASFAVYLGTYIVLTIFCLPVWPMPFVAGAIFGTLWGSVMASLSCAVAAAVTFLIARFIGHTAFRERLEASPRMRALEKTVAVGSWKIVGAVRLSHFLPFGMQNYGFGLTRIGIWKFVIATWAVTLPGTILQAYLGHLGFTSVETWQAESAPDWQTWSMRIAGLVVLAGAVGYIGYLARTVYVKAVREQLDKQLLEEAKTRDGGFPLVSVLLLVLAIGFVAAAAWAVLERDALQSLVEQNVSDSDSPAADRR